MAEQLESILARLLVPDNNVIQEATQQLKAVIKAPEFIPAVCTVLGSSQHAQVRQYAAVLLRRKVLKGSQWRSLSPELNQNIRGNVLQLLLQEQEKPVRKAIAQLVGTVAKHELPQNTWPEFFQFVTQHVQSPDPQHHEVGMYVLSVTATSASTQLQPHLVELIQLCSAAMDDQQNHMVQFYAIKTLTSMVAFVGTQEQKRVQDIVPKIMAIIGNLVSIDEDLATEALEVFDELVECEVGVIMPHIKPVIEFCLQIGAKKDLSAPLRIKALSFVSWLTRLKRKTIVKLKLAEPILHVLFPIMCEEADDDEDEREYEEAEASTAPSFAGQVIDVLALNLPPEKFMPQLMKLVEPALQSEDPSQRKAALLAMAVSAEGCADNIRNKHLKNFLAVVCRSVNDPSPQVRNAALFAMGQFSEHLQPDISKYSAELLPLLFSHISKVSQELDKDPKALTKAYYALEMFCENLEKEILPYLSDLMTHLLTALSSATSPHAKELAISAIGATANAAGEEIVPYFGQIIEQLKGFLTEAQTEEQLKVQMQALDTLAVLARNMKSHFLPLAGECLQLALNLQREATDPDLKRCIYGLLGALSTLIKEDMGPHMAEITKEMLASVKSTEGITAHLEDESALMFSLFDEEEEDLQNGGEDTEDEEVAGYSVNNAYISEKEDAVDALGELAENTGVVFMPYMEESFKEVMALADHIATDVRKTSMTTLGKFCIAVSKAANLSGDNSAKMALSTMLCTAVPEILRVISEDTERQVVIAAMEALTELLKEIGTPVLEAPGANTMTQIMNVVKDVMLQKIACQDSEESADPELDQNAEYDSIVIEVAGEVMPALAKVIGGTLFAPYFAGILPDIIKKLRKQCTVADKSFAVGTLADSLEAMGPASAPFAQHLYPLFVMMSQDEDEEVRSNAVFATGVLAANAGQFMHTKYADLLKLYLEMLRLEKDRRVLDNICAAMCRMMGAYLDGVPMDTVFPALIQHLPLGEDMEENSTVYKCISQLYSNGHEQVLKQVPQLLNVFSKVLGSKDLKEEVQGLIVAMVVSMSQQFADDFQKTLNAISDEQRTQLQMCLQLNGTS